VSHVDPTVAPSNPSFRHTKFAEIESKTQTFIPFGSSLSKSQDDGNLERMFSTMNISNGETGVSSKFLKMFEATKDLDDAIHADEVKIDLDQPKELKVTLLPHQQVGLKFLLTVENSVSKGGLLCDDMGLGKTIQMIALMLAHKTAPIDSKEAEDKETKEEIEDDDEIEFSEEDSEDIDEFVESDSDEDISDDEPKARKSKKKPSKTYSKSKKTSKSSTPKTTLIICPVSLLHHWKTEIQNRCTRNALKVMIYHSNSKTSAEALKKYDVVITTYGMITSQCKKLPDDTKDEPRLSGVLGKIHWLRLVLDEAHTIKNPKAKITRVACALKAHYRWCLSGTPVHNSLEDMYSLLKFLRIEKASDRTWWLDNIASCTKSKRSVEQDRG
jgi:transcription termination factor 2